MHLHLSHPSASNDGDHNENLPLDVTFDALALLDIIPYFDSWSGISTGILNCPGRGCGAEYLFLRDKQA